MTVTMQDICPGCGLAVADFEWGGYEDERGQRGHYECTGRPQPEPDRPEKEIFPDPVVSQSHIIADLEKELGKARRDARRAMTLLIDARSALAEGRLNIVDEFTDRALTLISGIPVVTR